MRVCTLMSGSSGNAIYIESEKAKVLIDAGQAGKTLTRALQESCGVEPGDLDAILVTHAHRDHIHGAGIMSRKYDLPLYATEGTWCEMSPLIGKIKPDKRNYLKNNASLELGDLTIETFPTSHDAMEPVGFICRSGDKSVGIATDSGVFTTAMGNRLRNVNCLVLESNHDPEMLNKGPYPWSLKRRIASILGHLSNDSAGAALLKTIGEKTRNVILAHLSEENNRPALALKTVLEILEKNQVSLEEVDITVAPRYRAGTCVRI